jgi:pilus assembly protein CpaF
VVQVSRLQDGTRKILSISEVLGVHDEKIELQEIFTFERVGVTDAGKVQGRFRATGWLPGSWNGCAAAAFNCRRASLTKWSR